MYVEYAAHPPWYIALEGVYGDRIQWQPIISGITTRVTTRQTDPRIRDRDHHSLVGSPEESASRVSVRSVNNA